MKPFRVTYKRNNIYLIVFKSEYDWEVGKYRMLGFDSDGILYALHQDDIEVDVKSFGKKWFK